MTKLSFEAIGSKVERFAASPTLSIRLRVNEATSTPVHTIALRAQVQIEPQYRRYAADESALLVELFGAPSRYSDTMRPLLWTHVSHMVLGFQDQTEFDLPIPCSYDFEVGAHKYLAALGDGEIPVNLLFSGSVFVRGEHGGVATELVPWTCEARYRLPVAVWREAMDAFFPGGAWIRVNRDVFEEVYRFKTAAGLPTWDAALTRLLELSRIER